MINIDSLIDNLCVNNSINIDDISSLNLSEEDFEKLIKALNERFIAIENTPSEFDQEYFNDTNFYEANGDYLNEIGQIPLLSSDEERELFIKVKNGDTKAKEKIIVSNLKLVVSIAKLYCKNKSDFLDLVEEGNIGLMKAIEKFDLSKGCRFSTYATWWIRQSISRATAYCSLIRKPVYFNVAAKKLISFEEKFMKRYGRKPTCDEISEYTGLDVEDITRIKDNIKLGDPLSIDTVNPDFDEQALGEKIKDDFDYEEVILRKILTEDIKIIMKSILTEKEYNVLILRTEKCCSLDEVGKIYGVGRERIRQIEAKALRKIRTKLKTSHKDEFVKFYKRNI